MRSILVLGRGGEGGGWAGGRWGFRRAAKALGELRDVDVPVVIGKAGEL